MRELPHMRYGDGIVKQTQVRFGGYNHSKYAKDGEIYDMRNMTSNIYPLMTEREKRDFCRVSGERVIYKGNVYEFIDSTKLKIGRDISGLLNYGDLIELKAAGDYAPNSGRYIVSGTASYGEGFIALDREFEVKGGSTEAKIQDNELTLTLIKRNVLSGKSEQTDIRYQGSAENTKTISYDVTEEGWSKTTVAKSSRDAYYEKTVTSTNTIAYKAGTTYSGVQFYKDGDKFRLYDYTDSGKFINVTKQEYVKVEIDGFGTIYMRDVTHPNSDNYYFYDINGHTPQDMTVTATFYGVDSVDSVSATVTDDTKVTYENFSSTEYRVESDTVIIKTVKSGSHTYEVTTVTTVEEYSFCDEEGKPCAIGSGDKLYYVTEDGRLWYDNEFIGRLSPGEKSICATGAYLFILPDKGIFNLNTKELTVSRTERIKQIYHSDLGYRISINNNIVEFHKSDEITEWVTVGNSYDIRVYSVSGQMKLTTAAVTEKTSTKITFDKEIDSFYIPDISYITVSNGFPDLRYACGANNRVWGCDDKNIYCSAFGQPEKWNYFETGAAGVSDNSWSIQPFDNAGEFTGCTVERGAPVFFKENVVYKVYGNGPGSFNVETYNIPGVMKGSAKSVVRIKNDIYYLSAEGVMRYSGGMCENISREFYQTLEGGVGGTDGVRYYLSCRTPEGVRLFVYNTNNYKWCIEDESEACDFTYFNRRLLMLDKGHNLLNINPGELSYPVEFLQKEEEPEGFIEFADYYCDSPDKKAISKLYIRFTVENGGSVKIEINYDSEEEDGKRKWRLIKEIESGSKRSCILPVIPRRADHFRIRISGKGFTLYSLSHEYYNGTANG